MLVSLQRDLDRRRGAAARRTSTAGRTGRSTTRSGRCTPRARRSTRSPSINALQARGILEDVGGKAAINTLASTVPSVSNARRYAEIVRETSTYRGLIRAGTRDRRPRLPAAGRSAGGGRQGRAGRVRDRQPARLQRLQPDQGAAERLVRADLGAAQERPRHHRRAQRLPRPRPDHRRLPALQPDHPGRPAGHGQDVAGAQRRLARRHPRGPAGRDLLDRDVARRGHPAADVRRGQGRLQPPAHRQAGARTSGRG